MQLRSRTPQQPGGAVESDRWDVAVKTMPPNHQIDLRFNLSMITELGGSMKTIGIRVSPRAVTFAIYDAEASAVVNLEDIVIPVAFETPEALKYVRGTLLDILREYGVTRAGIRATEPNAQHPSFERIEIEGVIKEAFASSDLEAFYVGHISSIASRLGRPRTDMKPLFRGEDDPGVENWSKLKDTQREAILCAQGAIDA